MEYVQKMDRYGIYSYMMLKLSRWCNKVEVVIHVKSDRSAATENTGPTVPDFTPTPVAKPLLELLGAQRQVLSMISIQNLNS